MSLEQNSLQFWGLYHLLIIILYHIYSYLFIFYLTCHHSIGIVPIVPIVPIVALGAPLVERMLLLPRVALLLCTGALRLLESLPRVTTSYHAAGRYHRSTAYHHTTIPKISSWEQLMGTGH